MLAFPNAKINIGLNITEKRNDGFHNLETVMVPVPLCDSLEFIESTSLKIDFSGIFVDGDSQNNLVIKAYNQLKARFDIPPVHIHLHKHIPMGAGLGGGSSDGAFMLKMLNDHFSLGLATDELENISASLGSDCPFFIQNTAVLATGRGEITEAVSVNLSGYHLLLIKPTFGIPTKEAYSNVVPVRSILSLKEIIESPVENWRGKINNQFEETLFPNHPELAEIKAMMYQLGAVYSSMTGSGSAVYGLFNSPTKHLQSHFNSEYFAFSSAF